MSDAWRWEYDPDHEHVAGGIPGSVVAEVERLTAQLVDLSDLGIDVGDMGYAPRYGGLRRMDAAGGLAPAGREHPGTGPVGPSRGRGH
ncbi:hypothetical protein P8605_45365 [Streptomyces sp. T-3]|nr:hypothetical protein [Streptomyces sp. T-3]